MITIMNPKEKGFFWIAISTFTSYPQYLKLDNGAFEKSSNKKYKVSYYDSYNRYLYVCTLISETKLIFLGRERNTHRNA